MLFHVAILKKSVNKIMLSRRENRFFDLAKSIAKTSNFHKSHVGCCVVHKWNVLSVASNSEKTHTLQRIYNKYRNFDIDKSPAKLHAEIYALSWLINKNIDWKDIEIYVYRELNDGTSAISKPCLSCKKLIEDLGIKTVYYIDEHGKRVKERI